MTYDQYTELQPYCKALGIKSKQELQKLKADFQVRSISELRALLETLASEVA